MNSRRVAFESLISVEESDAYLNLVLPRLLDKASLSVQDAAFATELAYGTSRNQGFYDWITSKVTGRPIEDIDLEALVVLRLGAHQLVTLKTPGHAAIFETVELAKKVLKQSAVGFVNAALRRISEKSYDQWLQILQRADLSEDDYLAIRYSHPTWVVRSIRLALQSEGAGDELETALEADNRNPAVNLVLLPSREEPQSEQLEHIGVSPLGYELQGGDPSKLPGVMNGSMRVQDQGSQLSALVLSNAAPVQAGEEWLDLCAGPGGKAALLAALGAGSGVELTTNEPLEHRADLVETALRHSGLKARQLRLDGRDLPKNLMFDRIMLDAPCTGLGALRRRPESRWRKNADQLKELSAIQRELLQSAWQHLKPGGILAYVTCSPHPSETTSQVEWFLRSNGDSQLLDAGAVVRELSPEIQMMPGRKTVQLWPHRNVTDAMFICLLSKQAD
jgi:16S rRNA (cytosine967-C5)-methyltransferase